MRFVVLLAEISGGDCQWVRFLRGDEVDGRKIILGDCSALLKHEVSVFEDWRFSG